MKTLKLAVVTDIHHGPNSQTKRGDKALELLEALVNEVNEQKPDLVVDLGDRISDVDKETDFKLEQEVTEMFKKLVVPYVHLLGNHDLEHLSREDNTIALGKSVEHQSQDIKGFHLVFWQPDICFPEGIIATDEQLDWLKQDLASTTLPSIIFTHAPYSEGSMIGNYYFENAPKHHAGYKNAKAIQELVNKSGVIACTSGHVHWNTLNTIAGIHHLTLQSLTESFTTQGEAAGSWTWLEFSRHLQVEVYGKDPFKLTLPIKQAGLELIA